MTLTGRYFQVWEFRVSHQQLLLRSPHDEQHPLCIDVIFAGVDYFALPHCSVKSK
jgi:hypothetical protein